MKRLLSVACVAALTTGAAVAWAQSTQPNPGVAPPMPQAAVFFAVLEIIVPCLFVSFGLVLQGMRGAATER